MKRYTQEDVDRMEEIRDEMSTLMQDIKAITRGDGHTEAYFTEHLAAMIDGDMNRYNLDFDKVIEAMQENIAEQEDEDEDEDETVEV